MQAIKIVRMQFRNFKGLRDLAIDFGQETVIRGDNATGKTSTMDGFLWLLFGKDSTDRKDFAIKTFDKHGNTLHKLDHEVSATLSVDGTEISLRKTYKEKWVKRRGSEVPEMSGHTTEYYYNDVPLSQAEYQTKISAIINEETFKLLTNPLYFNSLSWQKQREILFQLAGTIIDKDVAAGNPEFEKLLEFLSGKNIEELKRELAAKRKRLREELDAIPTRIDEANRNKPEATDTSEIEAKIAGLREQYNEIDRELENANEAHQKRLQLIRDQQNLKHGKEIRLSELQQKAKVEAGGLVSKLKAELNDITGKLSIAVKSEGANQKFIEQEQANINRYVEQVNSLRDKWNAENEKEFVFDNHKATCPTCKQALPATEIENLREKAETHFNEAKTKVLDEINTDGVRLKQRAEESEKQLNFYTQERDKAAALVSQLTDQQMQKREELHDAESNPIEPKVSEEEIALKAEIDTIVIETAPQFDLSEQKAKRQTIQNEIDAHKRLLGNKDVIESINKRIEELERQEKEFAQQLSSIEKTEFVIQQFNKEKIETVERRINSLFSYVRFKMFETQINGGEVETCECMVNGVPYSDVNNAARINAGIDIINAFIAHNQISAPIWVDNKESVNVILETRAQKIFLVVGDEGEALNTSVLNF